MLRRIARVGDLAIGTAMRNGTVYAGISPATGAALFATPDDAPERLMWSEALQYAACLRDHGHYDWRLPTAAELHVLYTHQDAIGNFNTSMGWYWTQDEYKGRYARTQRFSDGVLSAGNIYGTGLVRCVRGGHEREAGSLAGDSPDSSEEKD